MIKFKLTHPKRRRFGPKESETMSFQCVKKKKKIRAEEMQSGEEGEGEEEEEEEKKKKMDLPGQSTPA